MATQQGITYDTAQEGPFYRVRPHGVASGFAATSGNIESHRDTGQGQQGLSRNTIPQPLTDEAVKGIIKGPDNAIRHAAEAYTKQHLGKPYKPVDNSSSSLAKQGAIGRTFLLAATDHPEYKKAVYEAYKRHMPEHVGEAQDYDQLLQKAYGHLAHETKRQFESLPINMSFHRNGEGNYQDSKEMIRDVHGHRHLYVFQGGDRHDFLHNVHPESGLNDNEMFRAVHDVYGHALHGTTFGPQGEEKAWAAHSGMFSPLAQAAMTAETRGQNSVVNYTPLNARIKAEVAALDETAYDAKRKGRMDLFEAAKAEKKNLLDNHFQFAPQRAVLLPPEMNSGSYAGGIPAYIRHLIQPEGGETAQLTHFSHEPNLTMTDPTRYGTGIKGAEASRLQEPGAVRDRTYFYAGNPERGEVGLGTHKYKAMVDKLYDMGADPLMLRKLAVEANRTPHTSMVNPGLVDQVQAANDYERLIKDYGYNGMINRNLSMPTAAVFNPVPVQRQAQGGNVEPTIDEMQAALALRKPVHLAIGGQGPKNWIKGGVDRILNSLKQRTAVGDDPAETLAEMQRVWHPEAIEKAAKTVPTVRETIPRQMQELEHKAHLNNWIQGNLGNYIRKQMGTHNDPIRALAEQGILHVSPDQVGIDRWKAEHHRANWDEPKLGKSEHAQAWEDATDVAMKPNYVSHLEGSRREPWMDKVDPSTKVFAPTNSMDANALGFDHIIDILKQDMTEGRIRPEQLSKVSMEQAVRRAHEYNEERKRKMAETALKATEGMPVHKDYGNGFRWLELALDKNLPEGWSQHSSGTYTDPQGVNHVQHPNYSKLEEALKYEGDTMGHCVGGYCPDVASGNTRIFSLRDKKNEPHVTIEVNKVRGAELGRQAADLPDDEAVKIMKNPPERIEQIKGKGNAKPVAKYIPYAQDFVKSGNWTNVEDLHHVDMVPIGDNKYLEQSEAKKHYEPRIKMAIEFLQNHPAFKEQHAAKAKRDKDLLNLDYEDQHKLEKIYGQPLYPKSSYSAPELLNVIKKPEDNISSLNDYYPSLNYWLNEAERGMAHHGYEPPVQQKARGGIVYKATGGSMPSLSQMQAELMMKQPTSLSNITNVGAEEAPNLPTKEYILPHGQHPGQLPVGGIDMQPAVPGQQLWPTQPPAPGQQPQQGQQQPPQGAQPPQGGPQGQPPSNILQMTPQGQAMNAMTPPKGPQAMADGGGVDHYASKGSVTKRQQTVKNAQRMAYPGIYGRPDEIAALAASRVAPEDPILKQLFGVNRAEMFEQAHGRQGMPHLGVLPGASANPRGAEAAENVMNPRNERRLLDVLGEAQKHEGLRHGMEPWYYMDPLFQHMVKLLGPEKAAQEYKKMNALMGMASSASEVNTEIPRGSLAYYLQNQGRFNEFVQHGGKRDPNRPADFGEVPGHLAHKTTHAVPMKNFLTHGEVSMSSPKVPMYIEASGVPEIGFQTRTPVGDAHWSRAVGLADTRNPQILKGQEVVPGASVTNPEMSSLGPWWQQKIANKVGLESVPAQALAWGAFSPQTGVTTPIGAPKLELIAKQIGFTAKRLGVSPETARDLVLTGKERMGKKKGGTIKPVGHGITKEKVTISPNLDAMQYELMSVKHFKKAK